MAHRYIRGYLASKKKVGLFLNFSGLINLLFISLKALREWQEKLV